MECSCEINSGGCDEIYEENHRRVKISKTVHKCCECGRGIPPGEKYEKYYGSYEGMRYKYKTCMDCVSFRDNFFGDWQFEGLWETFLDHMYECGWQVPEKCLSKVTPAARAKICEMIEKYWEDKE